VDLKDWRTLMPREARAYADLMCDRGQHSEAHEVLQERADVDTATAIAEAETVDATNSA